MSDKLSTTTIIVDGMTCSQCERRIEKAVGELGGVLRSKGQRSDIGKCG